VSRQGTHTSDATLPGVRVDVYLRDGALATIGEDVRAGMLARPKSIPPKYFYDARGSNLFEQITRLPEYYPTRAEQTILDGVGTEIIESAQPEELIELGPGSARKTHALLDPMVDDGAERIYVPVDVSESAVRGAASRLAEQYSNLAIHGIVGDFERHFDRVPRNGRRLIAFLGGTIGNLDGSERGAMLRRLRNELGAEDRLLIGTDLVKERSRLEAAYNDSAGVTAEFNRNILRVINDNLDGTLEPERFDHVAFYDEDAHRMEMRLRARDAHKTRIEALDMEVEFEQGEEIHTEISCKFTRAGLAREYSAAGLDLLSWHTDEDRLFALSLAGPDGSR
jgi:L-histidine Nalpha-methyltransferase